MNPKKKILILSGCLLTVAAVVGGTLFVQKSSNHVLNKTSIGKFHEAEAHTATGFVVCKTEALQEVFQQKKEEAEKELQDMLAAAQEAENEEEVLLAEQEMPDESDGKNEKTDKKGTQEVTPGKGTTEPASTAGGQVRRSLQLRKTQRHPGDRNLPVKLRQHHQRHRQKLRQRHRQNSRQRKQNQQIHARIRFGQ